MRIDAKDIRQFLEDERIVRFMVDHIVAARQVPDRLIELLTDSVKDAVGDDLTPQLLFELLEDPSSRKRLIRRGVESGTGSRKRTVRATGAPSGKPSEQALDAARHAAVRATIAVLSDEIRNPLTTILVTVQARRERGRLSKGEQGLLESIEVQAQKIEQALRRLFAVPQEILIRASELDLPIA